jgi:Methyltransferase domain
VARSVVAVDPHQALNSLPTFTANLVGHEVADRVEVLVLPSRVALPALHAAGRRFELIFIDGDHTPAAVGFDATWARALVTADGTIAFHDYHAEKSDPIRQGLVSWPEPEELVERLAVYRGRWPA